MKIKNLFEGPNKKNEPPKPRNFVAKNAMKTTSGAGAHRDKKKEQKQGYEKHKGKEVAEEAAGVGIVTKQNATVDVPVGGEYMNVKKLFPKNKKVKDESVSEGGVLKSIQRGLKGWQGSSHLTDIQDYIRNASDKTLLFLYKNPGESPYKQTPRDIQIKLINRELKRRYGVKPGEPGVEEGNSDWSGSQGRFAGDVPVELGGAVSKRLDVGDVVSYFGEKATIQAMSKDRTVSRIDLKSGITQNVKTSDLKRVGQGVAEGMFGLSAKEKGKIQYVTAKISDIPGNWDHKNQTYTEQGLKDLKSVMKNEKYLKYALSLTADDYEADLEENSKFSATDDVVGFTVNSEKAYNVVMRQFGDYIDFDEDDGVMYIPEKMWPKVEMTAFDADGEGATRVDDDRSWSNNE